MKTVFITGAARGIGRATALLFAERGWNVAFGYVQSTKEAIQLENELKDKGVSAKGIRFDVASYEECNAAVAEAENSFGKIDSLVNNAGISVNKLLMDMTDEEWRRIFAVNTDGVFNMCRAVIPHMLNGNCSIVNVSSMWGITGASCEAAYSASKAAVIGLTKALAKELGLSAIRVNCIAPGVIMTDMNKNLSENDIRALEDETPLGRIGDPSEVAKAIYFLASDEASFITGQTLSVDGGFVI
mgnify:CR=1 FL=1